MKFKYLLFFTILFSGIHIVAQKTVEKWKVFELTLKGPEKGNPFTDVNLNAIFVNDNDTVLTTGFYDGNGIYKIRFMPDIEGKWSYVTSSNIKSLNRKKGKFNCTSPQKKNHGKVVVSDNIFFSYEDGTPYNSFGTTCYAWVHQGDSLADLTIKTLSNGYFNKLRMCIFPKSYDWNHNEPIYYPFEGEPLKNWNYTRFNPAYFRNIEKRILQLDSLGIEADLIVFHPYDRWGYSKMDRATEDMYIRYIIARFSAYKNVWWSIANEFDLVKGKTMDDWDHYIEMFAENDPFHHLISIHNGAKWYNHSNPLITHVSIQNSNTRRANEFRKKYNKPVIYDECQYEGNIPWTWGNITAQTLTMRFWQGFINGGHVGHGETYVTENPVMLPGKSSDILWWSKGGVLRGESPDRIKFLREIIESAPAQLRPANILPAWLPYASTGIENEYYLAYFNDVQPRSAIITLPKDSDFKVEIIDTWDMTITPLNGSYSGRCLIELPGKPYIAIRVTKITKP